MASASACNAGSGPGLTEPSSDELSLFSVADLRKLIDRREVSATELVKMHLARISSVNDELNAVVTMARDRALAEANSADKKMRLGLSNGPLHGIPMTIKDSFDTEGVLSTAGTPGRKSFVPDKDATAVARLRSAGAILLGKTNTPEITFSWETDNRIFGITHNPYDLSRTPGGSSGGAAAIVAGGGSPFDIGSDTMGSIRQPAHFCGIASLKPTAGRVPRTGHVISYAGTFQSLTQPGPMTRYVGDLELLLGIISGPDNIDPWIAPVPLRRAADLSVAGLRCAFFTNNTVADPSPAIADAVTAAAQALDSTAAAVEEASPPGMVNAIELMSDLLRLEGGAWVRRVLAAAGTDDSPMLAGPQSNKAKSAEELSSCFETWDNIRSEMLTFWRNHDVLICPVSAVAALPINDAKAPEAEPAFSYTVPFSVSGWPCVVVRCGWTSDSLPIGLQVVAPPWREDICIAVAQFLEQELGGYSPPPGLV